MPRYTVTTKDKKNQERTFDVTGRVFNNEDEIRRHVDEQKLGTFVSAVDDETGEPVPKAALEKRPAIASGGKMPPKGMTSGPQGDVTTAVPKPATDKT